MRYERLTDVKNREASRDYEHKDVRFVERQAGKSLCLEAKLSKRSHARQLSSKRSSRFYTCGDARRQSARENLVSAESGLIGQLNVKKARR